MSVPTNTIEVCLHSPFLRESDHRFVEPGFADSGWPIIKIAELKDGVSAQTKLTQQTFEERYHVKMGDMLFSWSGNPDTSIDVFWWRESDGWLNQHIFRVEPTDVDRTFFFYLLRYLRPTFGEIASNKQTTGLGHVTAADLKALLVGVPPLRVQESIARVLGSLDDKIELNRRMNSTLEQIAQALFKSWFVDFDPVRAKADGRWKKGESLPGMPADMWDLWPSEFEESEIGEVPKGWIAGTLANLVENVTERMESTAEKDALRYIALDDMPSRSVALTSFRSGTEVNSSIIRFRTGDILFGAMRPYFHKVGLAQFDGITRSTSLVLRPRDSAFRAFVLFKLADNEVVDFATAASVGTTIPYVHWESLAVYPTVLPSRKVIDAFDSTVEPPLRLMGNLGEQSRSLSTARDALLPKLLSGEIRVPVDGGK